jgi:PAS domain S-box-containing protein
LAAIVESSDDAIVSKNLDGTVTSWNPAAERLFGYTAEEMIGRPISILAAPDRENEMPVILESIRRGEKIHHYETVRRRKDGSLVDISLVSPIVDETGRIVGASKIARDITARKRLEEHQRMLTAELSHASRTCLPSCKSSPSGAPPRRLRRPSASRRFVAASAQCRP